MNGIGEHEQREKQPAIAQRASALNTALAHAIDGGPARTPAQDPDPMLDDSEERPGLRRPGARSEANGAMRQRIGARLAAARELNGLGQLEAAKMMGYENSTQLSLWETGQRLPPHAVLVVLSETYAVSIDYLMGVSDEPERDPKGAEIHALLRTAERMLKEHAASVTETLTGYIRSDAPSIVATAKMLNHAEALTQAVTRFREANKSSFDELKTGATLVRTCNELAEATTAARNVISRHERIMQQTISSGAAAMRGAAGSLTPSRGPFFQLGGWPPNTGAQNVEAS